MAGKHKGRRPIVSALFVGVFLLGSGLVSTGFTADAYPNVFGSQERRISSPESFTKWHGMLERFYKEIPAIKAPCDPAPYKSCGLQYWNRFLLTLIGLDRMSQLEAVNSYLNEGRYVTDPINWHVPDYWETPAQFFDKQGDCEDYAISKYLSLKALGFKPGEMRIFVIRDVNLGTGHAVLVVYLDGAAMLLDNQFKQVIDARRVRHYRAVYSINEEYWWNHSY